MRSDDPPPQVVARHVRQRVESRTCPWCSAKVPYTGRGRPAEYCSKACRNRAWEVRSAERRLQRDIAAGLRQLPMREVIRETVTETHVVTVQGPPREPATAWEWLEQLAELAEQLRAGDLGRQHWQHAKLYGVLVDVVVALGDAYPGGLERLQRKVPRR
ncbi:hypothetical protein ACFV1N_37315 [Streptosporangium canum]|uniref:hypothetical protein n=1 Tax=Streptosporangium canum TaxID=324952 RepID=UPI00367D0455